MYVGKLFTKRQSYPMSPGPLSPGPGMYLLIYWDWLLTHRDYDIINGVQTQTSVSWSRCLVLSSIMHVMTLYWSTSVAG